MGYAAAFIVIVLLAFAGIAAAQDGCSPASCGGSGPTIRYPFRLKNHQPVQCGYPSTGFEFSCSAANTTITELEIQHPVRISVKNLVFPLRVKIQIKEIDYLSQRIGFRTINSDCLPNKLPSEINLNSSSLSPFKLIYGNSYEYNLFNCSSSKNNSGIYNRFGTSIPCLSGNGYQVRAFGSSYSTSDFSTSSCIKMYNISHVPSDIFIEGEQYDFTTNYLEWFRPSCGKCESQGLECRLKKNSTDDAGTECIDIPRSPQHGTA